jgi:ankyrin repeat protein
MLSDDDITKLQLAVEKSDLDQIQELLQDQDAEELTGLQLFAEHTLLMYACERATPQVVELLLSKGTQFHELEWSANNELKSTLRNENHRNEILPLVLKATPGDIKEELIKTDWDPDELSQGEAKSPLEMARELEDQTCFDLLKNS